MPVNQAERPRYFEGQFLGADDLMAAVAHGDIHEARHLLGAHTWGIALGLDIIEKASLKGGSGVDAYLSPGLAVDGFGRTIAVLAPYAIPPDLFKPIVYDPAIDGGNPAGRLVAIWLRYREAELGGPASGFRICDVEDQNSRVMEGFAVVAGPQTTIHESIVVANRTMEAAKALRTFDPSAPLVLDESIPQQQFPYGNPDARWLIPVGYVRWLPSQDVAVPGSFVARAAADLVISASVRRYVGVVAGNLYVPAGRLRVKDRGKANAQPDSFDLVQVEGSLRVNDDVKLFGGKLDLRDATGGDPAVPSLVMRATNAAGGADVRVVIGKAVAGNNRFAVGPVDSANNFAPKFVVLDNGNVGFGTEAPASALDVAGSLTMRGNRTYLTGLDSAKHHWIMAGGTDEAANQAIGLAFNGGNNNQFHTGNGWVKGFRIDHPSEPRNQSLTHATLEGPEAAVFYRGEGQLSEGRAAVTLPAYFEQLTRKEKRTVTLTPKFQGDDEPISVLAASAVKDGAFTVRSADGRNASQAFYWEVKAVRADVAELEAVTAKSR